MRNHVICAVYKYTFIHSSFKLNKYSDKAVLSHRGIFKLRRQYEVFSRLLIKGTTPKLALSTLASRPEFGEIIFAADAVSSRVHHSKLYHSRARPHHSNEK